MRSPYASLFPRLVSNTYEPPNEQACWVWTGRRKCRYGYGKTTLYVPGLNKTVSLYAHVLLFVSLEACATAGDDAWLAYQELQASGLELDHLCVNPSCINIDHLKPVTPQENSAMRGRRA